VPLASETVRQITALRDRYPHPRSAILPCLWAVQNELGYLSPEGMAEVASILDLAPSEVQAVSTFYSMYFDRPAGDHHLIICVNVSCALRGSDAIVEHVEHRLGCPSGGTTEDRKFTWESTVECLGACGGAPAMQVDHHFHEDLTPERIDAILERLRAEPAPAEGNGHAPRRRRRAGEAAPLSGPHPPAGETPPVTTAEGPPADTGVAAPPAAQTEPIAEHTEMPGSRTKGTGQPRGSRSAPRKRPRLDPSDL
jgi:NADH-quinone oxidoreductase subunit E